MQFRQSPSKTREVLVLWEGRDKMEATWEDATKLFAIYPNAHLEDKVLKLVGNIVTPTVPTTLKTYQRRRRRDELAI